MDSHPPRYRARRSFMRVAQAFGMTLAALAFVAPPPAQAQQYPERPVRIVIGVQAGASTDVLGRLLAQKLGERLGQQFFIDNKPGAASRIAMELVAKAPADGYTVGISNAVATNFPLMFDNFAFVPGKDFVPVAMLGRAPSFLVVRATLPVKNVREFVAYAKANSGKISYGHGGAGSNPHLATLTLVRSLGLNAVGATYRGTAPTALAVAAGEVDFALLDYPSVRPLVESGRVRILAVTEPRRVAMLPDMLTSGEQGLTRQIDGMTPWFMLVAPAGTPAAVVALLNRQANEVLKQKDVQQTLLAAGIEPEGGTVAEAAAYFQAQRERTGTLAREMNISFKE